MTVRPEERSGPRDEAPGSVEAAGATVADVESDVKADAASDAGSSRYVTYAPDALSTPGALIRVCAAALCGGLLTLAAFFVLRSTSLAAFNVSMVTRALATACSLIVILAVAVLCWLWIRDRDGSSGRRSDQVSRPAWRRMLTEAVCSLAPAGLVISSLGIPLSPTKLYLDGIQVDQGFRTQFLTRMAETASNQDMNYVDMPSFYPLGWFWLGGRMANLLNMPGWEVYQPWALVSLAAAASALVPLWRKLTGSLPVAATIGVVTTAIILTMVPEEPYAAVVAMFVPAAAVLGYHAMRGSWSATFALMAYLGVSACFYTLYTGITALTMVVFAFIAFFTTSRERRTLVPFRQLIVIGLGSILIALIAWGPYLYRMLTAPHSTKTSAQHFLPSEGTIVPLPFFELSLVGVLCFIGLIYLIVRFREPEFTHLAIAVGVCYVWVVASMVVTLVGTTLLGFRVEALIALLLSTTGILALADLRLTGIDRLYPTGLSERTNRGLTAVFSVVLALATVGYIQQIPDENESYLDQAYTGTDGYGERADRRESDVGRYYIQMNQFIQDRGYTPTETVLFTDEINFMAYHPYHGFNAFTSHYANPLGEFEARNELIASWARGSYEDLQDPEAMTAAIDASPWRAPDAFIFRGNEKAAGSDDEEETPWKTHIAHDIFPSQPNVHYQALFFNPEAFDSAAWTTEQFGPFVVVVRNR